LPSFTLRDHTEVTPDVLSAIAARHGFAGAPVERLPETGIFNAVYRLGRDAILRIPRNHPNLIADGQRQAIAVPAAVRAGVRTPRLLAFDDSLDLLPVPYTVYERVSGVPLESLGLDPAEAAEVWREHGRTLGQIHSRVSVEEVAGLEVRAPTTDLRALVEDRAEEGWLSPLDARWLGAWVDRLAHARLDPVPHRLLHGDTQATNLMVTTEPLAYQAVIDWGSAGLGDPALDFGGVPLRAVPYVLAGHREVAPLDADDTAEQRILWRQLHLALLFLPRGAVPGRSWAERPLPMLLEILRFFADPPDDRWREIGPVAPARALSSSLAGVTGGADHA
jgi:aminoglycoside phosphotransferase (APT) family kinase protein